MTTNTGKTPSKPAPAAPAAPAAETLETLAKRVDHLDGMTHDVLARVDKGIEILTATERQLAEVRAQLVQVDSKQNAAAGLLQRVHEGVHEVADNVRAAAPLLEHAQAFLANPVRSYLDKMKGKRHGTEG